MGVMSNPLLFARMCSQGSLNDKITFQLTFLSHVLENFPERIEILFEERYAEGMGLNSFIRNELYKVDHPYSHLSPYFYASYLMDAYTQYRDSEHIIQERAKLLQAENDRLRSLGVFLAKYDCQLEANNNEIVRMDHQLCNSLSYLA